jgi:hypothetical protein
VGGDAVVAARRTTRTLAAGAAPATIIVDDAHWCSKAVQGVLWALVDAADNAANRATPAFVFLTPYPHRLSPLITTRCYYKWLPLSETQPPLPSPPTPIQTSPPTPTQTSPQTPFAAARAVAGTAITPVEIVRQAVADPTLTLDRALSLMDCLERNGSDGLTTAAIMAILAD